MGATGCRGIEIPFRSLAAANDENCAAPQLPTSRFHPQRAMRFFSTRQSDSIQEVELLQPKKRLRSLICLMFFFSSSIQASRGLDEVRTTAEQLGEGFAPVLFLILTLYFSFKDRAKVVRVVATALLALNIFLFGQGLFEFRERMQAGEDSRLYLETARSIALDAIENEDTSGMLDRHRMAASKLAGSSNATAAHIGRMAEIELEIVQSSLERFGIAADALQDENFVNEYYLLANEAFEEQSSIANAFLVASTAAVEVQRNMEAELLERCTREGLPQEIIDVGVEELRCTSVRRVRLFEAHVAVAEEYVKFIRFIQEHKARFHFCETPGSVCIRDDETRENYDLICESYNEAHETLDMLASQMAETIAQ